MFGKIIKNSQIRKASSLVEVLIILGIISTAVIASTTIAINSQKTLIKNEREEVVNASMLKALEITKSPSDIRIVGSVINSGSEKNYRLTKQITPERFVLEERIEDLVNCSPNSPFQVSIDVVQEGVNFPLCLSVSILKEQVSGKYKITVKAVYDNSEGQTTKILVGYRNEEFLFL
jgi:hypothetical protein